MLWVTTVALAVVVGVLLLVVGDELVRRPKERLARTADLLLSLHVEEGLALLEQERQRSDVWWTDAAPLTRREIDRALSSWDLVASLARSGRIEQPVVVQHFGSQVVDLWELAYPYVQHRHEQQPRLWESLAELYLDAFETSHQPSAPQEEQPAAEPAVASPNEPRNEPAAEPPVAAVAAETAVPPEPPPASQPSTPVETHQLLIAALRDLPPILPTPPAPRSGFTVDTAAEPRPAAQHPPLVAFEEVVDLVPHPSTRRE